LPALYTPANKEDFAGEREILYKILFDMRNEINQLKSVINKVAPLRNVEVNINRNFNTPGKEFSTADAFFDSYDNKFNDNNASTVFENNKKDFIEDTQEVLEETLSLRDKEIEMIKKALIKHKGKRKNAADELEISERTLYRKIKEYELE